MEETISTAEVREAPAPASAGSPTAIGAPLFYRRPVLLSSRSHGDWRLRAGDLAFAAQAHAVPLAIGEFAPASRSYPIVFAAADAAPLALLGLERSNLFLSDGRWDGGHYIPAYVRRYPFVLVRTEHPDGFALAIDAASDRVVQSGDEGVPLFDGEVPGVAVAQALEFCRLFAGEHRATQGFVAALRSQGLLAGRDASVTLAGGRTLSLTGFKVVDADRFSALPEQVVADWHRKGWLALVSFHLSSLRGFSDLLPRQGRIEASRAAARREDGAQMGG
jgi:hypothetical protein